MQAILGIIVGVVFIISTIVAVVWAFSKCAPYKYVDDTFVRKDIHTVEYTSLLNIINELKDKIDKLIEDK